MKSKVAISVYIIIISICLLFAVLSYYEINKEQYNRKQVLGNFYNTPVLGGFSIDTTESITNAAADGLHTDLLYGFPPSETDSLGQALKAHHMTVIDGALNTYLYYYECHKLQTCARTIFPELTSVQALLKDVRNHLQQEKNNSSIVGFWILDDWPANDLGSAKDILAQENALIHQYTPGRPSICGFGGSIYPEPTYHVGWSDGVAANFSPQGCNMIGLYIYGAPNTTGTYDWTMSDVLPAMFKSLSNRGWDMTKEPFIGIPQAFGGTIGGEPWPVSTAVSIEVQSRSFCQNGASGIIYYAWNNSGLNNTSQLPSNNMEINRGIRNGIAACKQYWSELPR